jgi:hypothetical protein
LNRKFIITSFLLVTGFWAAPSLAQDADVAEDLPAFDTSQMPVDETEDINPAVDTSSFGDGSDDSGTLTTTIVTGNAELPRVLYIVPWKKASPGDLLGRPVNSLLDDVLQPVDRGEFRRQLRYYHALNQGEVSGGKD